MVEMLSKEPMWSRNTYLTQVRRAARCPSLELGAPPTFARAQAPKWNSIFPQQAKARLRTDVNQVVETTLFDNIVSLDSLSPTALEEETLEKDTSDLLSLIISGLDFKALLRACF